MTLNDLSTTEGQIIQILRELRAHECVEIKKDQNGRPDYFIVTRSQKIVITETLK